MQYTYPSQIYPPAAPTQSPEQEIGALENYKKELETEKADLEKEMNEIETRIKESKAKLEQEMKQ
jgi:predicted  nucleic acid-binding Zn-ribbon protein